MHTVPYEVHYEGVMPFCTGLPMSREDKRRPLNTTRDAFGKVVCIDAHSTASSRQQCVARNALHAGKQQGATLAIDHGNHVFIF